MPLVSRFGMMPARPTRSGFRLAFNRTVVLATAFTLSSATTRPTRSICASRPFAGSRMRLLMPRRSDPSLGDFSAGIWRTQISVAGGR